MDFEERSSTICSRARQRITRVGETKTRDRDQPSVVERPSYGRDAPEVLGAVSWAEPEVVTQPNPHSSSVEDVREVTRLKEEAIEGLGYLSLAGDRQTRQPEGDRLLSQARAARSSLVTCFESSTLPSPEASASSCHSAIALGSSSSR